VSLNAVDVPDKEPVGELLRSKSLHLTQLNALSKGEFGGAGGKASGRYGSNLVEAKACSPSDELFNP